MKTILVDAYNTLVTEEGLVQEMYEMLEKFPNKKIILTNADAGKQKELGLVDLPYEMFSGNFDPMKSDPTFYTQMLSEYGLNAQDVVYFEHSLEAVNAAKSLGISVFHYDHQERNIASVEVFLKENL